MSYQPSSTENNRALLPVRVPCRPAGGYVAVSPFDQGQDLGVLILYGPADNQ